MYDNILVPVVFDEDHDTESSLKLAKTLAGKGGKITLLHVIETVPNYVLSYIPPEFLSESRKAVAGSLEDMAAKLPDATGEVVHGHPSRAITEWAKVNRADLIILASHRPGMQDLLLGSTASHVVRHAPCAVHVIR